MEILASVYHEKGLAALQRLLNSVDTLATRPAFCDFAQDQDVLADLCDGDEHRQEALLAVVRGYSTDRHDVQTTQVTTPTGQRPAVRLTRLTWDLLDKIPDPIRVWYTTVEGEALTYVATPGQEGLTVMYGGPDQTRQILVSTIAEMGQTVGLIETYGERGLSDYADAIHRYPIPSKIRSRDRYTFFTDRISSWTS